MPAPSLSFSQNQNAESARAAALQAEFNEKKWVWVPDEKEGYLAGWVIREDGEVGEGEVFMASGSETRKIPLYALSKMNPPKFDRVDDIADLTFLNEASVVHNLRLRYGSGAIYTYSGLFLVAINPYQNLPLYTDAIVQQYRNKRRDENPPHIFAIAERAWVSMGEERENQSILITGESGAGKTENTKKVIQYLAAIATDVHAHTHSRSPSLMSLSSSFTGLRRSPSTNRKSIHGPIGAQSTSSSIITTNNNSTTTMTAKDRLGLLERQILQANPILESFGNAQTQRNNNSSRFGKFVRISFAPDGSISGANIDWYLLEKSRVVVRSEAERSFHVFYQLLEGGSRELRDRLLLDAGIEDYEYLNKSRREVDGVNDREEWRALKAALDLVGFSPEEQFDLFRVVAAILHIGNVVITSTRSDDALMPDTSEAEKACHLLGIPLSEFTKAVLRPRVLAGREWVTQARTRQQALDELSSLCKTLYEKSFSALVDRVNRALDRPTNKSTFIGVLDIAGFEIFETNTYEQLLINYTNEKLQQFFNHHMFVLEQEEYAREGIEWDYVNFGLDLQPTIDLIESSGNFIGILSCLDEECIMPKATDGTFTHKLNYLWAADDASGAEVAHPGKMKYAPARFEQGFTVQHYAGKVEYRTDGWLEKNKDPLNDNLTRVFAASSESYISGLFAEFAEPAGLASSSMENGALASMRKRKKMVKKGAFRTVGQRHKEQLASLMNQLQATQPHFVRCIVPNTLKKAGRMDVPLVLDQLRCNGVLEGIRIARLGYPNRLPFVEFRQRYEVLTPGIIPRGFMDGRKAGLRMVDALELDHAMFRIGTSKIFFKAGVLAELEERRDALLFDIFSRLQAAARMWTARRHMKKIVNRALAVRTIQRNVRVYTKLREWEWWHLYTKVRPLLTATRNDEELRRKDAELTMIKERAERDQREKEALEGLKMQLESEKHRIEEELEAERALALDKDELLERSKKREGELEEEVATLRQDLDTLDSQLDRALENHKASEEKYKSLRDAFDKAAEHLVRLESGQADHTRKEETLNEELQAAMDSVEALNRERDTLQASMVEVQAALMEREEDLARFKERAEAAILDLEGKLEVESRTRDIKASQADALEEESRQLQEQLNEMGRTVQEYSGIIEKKDADMKLLRSDIKTHQDEHAQSLKEITYLQSDIDTLSAKLDAQQADLQQSSQSKAKLQSELDELRVLLAAKTSEETRRNEVERSKNAELSQLRDQVAQLQRETADARKASIEVQNHAKVELETAHREQQSLNQEYNRITKVYDNVQAKLQKVEAQLAEAEKSKRVAESELNVIRSKHLDLEGSLADATKEKELLRRQLDTAQSRHQDYEDAILQIEREKGNWTRQMEQTRKELDDERSKRTQLEKHAATQKAELVKLRDIKVKLDRELNKALNDLKAREWEVKQLESRQDKTIVEHVHVLEEAKRVTDRQLQDAQLELQKQASYIRSLEKVKVRLTSETEDLSREAEREARDREKSVRSQEERVNQARATAIEERRSRELLQIQFNRLQSDISVVQQQLADSQHEVALLHKSRNNLESELTKLADETETPGSLAKTRRGYESRIAALEEELEDSERARSVAERIKSRIDRQHAEIRSLIMSSNPRDDDFRNKLLQRLQLVEGEINKDFTSFSPRSAKSRAVPVHTYGNVTPTKSSNKPANGVLRGLQSTPEPEARKDDRQVETLKQQVRSLELQMAATVRVRQHLESALRDMTAELDHLDGSKQSLQNYRGRLVKENTRLSQLLDEEAKARSTSDASRLGDVQKMWTKFEAILAGERESYSRLDESRKALLAQQRAAHNELEDQRKQTEELARAKKQLESRLVDLQGQLEREQLAKNEEISAKRTLQGQLDDHKVNSATSSHKTSELQEALKAYRSKAESYLGRLEKSDSEKAKAIAKAEAAAETLKDASAQLTQARQTHKKTTEQLTSAQEQLKSLQDQISQLDRERIELRLEQQRVAEELQEERDRHQSEISEKDFAVSQTQKTYQGKLAQLSEELQSQRESITRLREENRRIRSDYDDLQLHYDEEAINGGAWKKEKERLETKINDLTNAYESSSAARAEQQSQIVGLHSQVRDLRGVIEEAEAERLTLQKARRALQAQLEGIQMDSSLDPDKSSLESKLQDLKLQKQNLERNLEERQDRVTMAEERMRKAETHAQECQMELGKIRVENSELDRLNANLEKQAKELNVKIVDLETKSYATPSRVSLGNVAKTHRTGGDGTPVRQRTRQEEDLVDNLRSALSNLQTSENALQLAKRKAELEAGESRAKALSLEHEVERLRSRLERPSSALIGSPAGSPRKA